MASAQDVFVNPNNYVVDQDKYFVGLNTKDNSISFDRFMNGVIAPKTTAARDEASQRAFEQASLASARAYEQALENTKYQRAVADLKKAGLNPWLAVQNGFGGISSGSVSGYSQTSSTSAKQNKTNTLFGVAALIKVLASLLA